MAEIDDLLTKYGQLSVEIGDLSEYLKALQEQKHDIHERIRAMTERGAQEQLPQLGFTMQTPVPEHAKLSKALLDDSALEATAKAVAHLGDSVTAAHLAAFMEITQDAARLRLQRAEKKGLIRRVAFGRYSAKPQIPGAGTKPQTQTATTEDRDSTNNGNGAMTA